MNYYKRKLPHWQPSGAEYFVTIRLKGSLPRSAIERLKKLQTELKEKDFDQVEDLDQLIQQKVFETYESLLDGSTAGPTWLANDEIAKKVEDSIHYRNTNIFDLYSYCIMPSHLHLVFKDLGGNGENPITEIMRNFKRYTARKSNEVLKRSGTFWQAESFDRVIRDNDELEKTLKYVLKNPVKAGLADSWKEWPYSFLKPEFLSSLNLR